MIKTSLYLERSVSYGVSDGIRLYFSNNLKYWFSMFCVKVTICNQKGLKKIKKYFYKFLKTGKIEVLQRKSDYYRVLPFFSF